MPKGATSDASPSIKPSTPNFDADGRYNGFTPIVGADGTPSKGLEAGGILNFALNLDPAFQGRLDLIPSLASSGLVDIARLTPDPTTPDPPGGGVPSDGGTSSGPGSIPVPEPLSLGLWSALIVLGLHRTRSRLRATAPRAQ